MFDPITFAAAVKAAGKPTDEQIAKYFEDHPEVIDNLTMTALEAEELLRIARGEGGS